MGRDEEVEAAAKMIRGILQQGEIMSRRHIAVTVKQFNKAWDRLPPHLRFNCDEDEPRGKAVPAFPVGSLLLWMDTLMPQDQWSEEVDKEIGAVIAANPEPPK